MSSPQRIAIISLHTSPLAPMGGKKTGGMNVYIRELAQELGRRGIAVDIFTRRNSAFDPEIDESLGQGVRVIYLNAGGVRPLAPDDLIPHLSEFTAKLIAFSIVQNVQYDLIYSHYYLSGWVAQKLKESWGTPFVQMFHTLGQMKRRISTSDALLPDERIKIEMDVVEWADAIIAATPAEHDQLMWLYRAKRRKIEIVPPGVNIERFSPQNQHAARTTLGLLDKQHVLLFVGRIEPLKSVDSIVQALAYLREQNPSLAAQTCLLIVGGDPKSAADAEMNKLKRLVDELAITDCIRFVGAQEQAQLALYYAASSAVVMPSEYESFGMVALEAMAAGRPVIASRVGGLAFVVRDGETGLHVPVRDPQKLAQAITQLLQDEQKQHEMGETAAHLAHDYTWQRIADRLLAIFATVQTRRAPRLNRRMS